MIVRFEEAFERDLKRLRDRETALKVVSHIDLIKSAQRIRQIRGLQKLTGFDNYYRIRVGDYRIGLEISGDTVIFVRFLHRKDIYRHFR